MKKWIFSTLIALAAMTAQASTTRVGNGDDGRDLEGGTQITSGPIFESRTAAVERLRALNAQGIPNMGFVIPELEYSVLLMSNDDVRPMSSEGGFETSDDKRTTYARTFAEPHAPTRFFPAALNLSKEQLIALHVHEALHRALPPNVREDEDKVALLTMALTSPSANFDRVNRVAQSIMPPPSSTTVGTWFSNSFSASRSALDPRAESPPEFQVEHMNYDMGNGGIGAIEKVSGEFTPMKPFNAFGYESEARISVSGFFVNTGTGTNKGPLSFIAKVKSDLGDNKSVTPFIRASLRSMETVADASRTDRDVYTLGAQWESQRPYRYTLSDLSYTAPENFGSNKGQPTIISYDLHYGVKVRRFQIGGWVGLDHMLAKAAIQSFSLVQIGPEIKLKMRGWHLGLSAGYLWNRGQFDLSDLGDLAGHGAGVANISGQVGIEL